MRPDDDWRNFFEPVDRGSVVDPEPELSRYGLGMTSFKGLWALGLLLMPALTHAADGPAVTVYTGARVIDGLGGPTRVRTIVVEGERIRAIGPKGKVTWSKKASRVALKGKTIIPGLINTHVHLAAPPDRRFAETLLKRNLYGGVTAVRSMGDDVRTLSGLARDTQLGEMVGPDIVYVAFFAGPGFFHDGRLQVSARGAEPGELPWMREIRANTNLPEAVTLARGAGVSGIKIYGNLDVKTVRALTELAHAQGLEAWAHGAIFPTSPLEAVEAGVDTLSHICMLAYQGQPMPRQYHDRADVDETRFKDGMPAAVRDVFTAMKKRGAILDATAYVYETIERMRALLPPGKGPPTYCSAALAKRMVKAAYQAGVFISVGTDAPAPFEDPFPAVFREMEILLEAGMPAKEVLRAASFYGAQSLGLEDEMGTLQKGKLANFVVLNRDPEKDLMAALRSIDRVIKRGKMYVRSDAAKKASPGAGPQMDPRQK